MSLDDIARRGLKIKFPKKFASVLDSLRERGFIISDEGGSFCVVTPTSYAITRTQARMSITEFYEFYRAITVVNGYKQFVNEAIHLRPKRPRKLSFRVSVVEHELIKFAARDHLLDVSDYIRLCVVNRSIESFCQAVDLKKMGVV